jgi:type I restriction enzyme S subunit
MEVKPGYKQTEVGTIPEDWDVKNLSDIGTALIGLTYKPTDVRSDGLLVLRASNIQQETLRFSDNVFVDMDVPERLMVRPGDILICVRNGSRNLIGKCAWIDDRAKGMTFGAFMVVFRTAIGRFVYHQFQSAVIKTQIREHLGATINQITNKSLNSFRIPLPPTKAEQEAIAEALSDADALIAALEQLLAKKRQLKQGATQGLLTGKKRLPGFSGEWGVKPLGDLFNFSAGFTASRDQLSSEGYCYLHYGDIHTSKNSFVDVRSEYQDIPKLDIPLKKISPVSLLNDGDVVFVDASEDDEGASKHVVVINPDGIPFISGLHTIVAKCKTDALEHQYRRYCFQTTAVKAQFRFFAVGTKVSGINKTNIARVTLPVPSVPEQAAIAAILSNMDAEITALEAKLAKARKLKQGMMRELLTGRIRLV